MTLQGGGPGGACIPPWGWSVYDVDHLSSYYEKQCRKVNFEGVRLK